MLREGDPGNRIIPGGDREVQIVDDNQTGLLTWVENLSNTNL